MMQNEVYSVTNHVYDANYHNAFDRDLARKMNLARAAAYIRAATKRVLDNATDGYSVAPLATFRLYAHGYELVTVRIYSDRVRVRCEDIDIARGEYEYMYAALADLTA